MDEAVENLLRKLEEMGAKVKDLQAKNDRLRRDGQERAGIVEDLLAENRTLKGCLNTVNREHRAEIEMLRGIIRALEEG